MRVVGSIVICLLLGVFNQVFAIKQVKLSSNDGLSSDEVEYIFQGPEGYMWIIGRNGIDRYDGYNITSFNRDFLQNRDINFSAVNRASVDLNNRIWFSSEKDGLLVYDPSNFEIKQIDLSSLASNTVKDILCDTKGRVWAATVNGLVLFNNIDEEPQVFGPTNKIGSLPDNYIQCLYEDSKGNVWIGTWGQGVCRYNETNNNFESNRIFAPKALNVRFETNQIGNISEDKNGNLWISAWKSGLFVAKYNGINLRVIDNVTQSNAYKEISNSDIVFCSKQSNDGTVYLGTPSGLITITDYYTDKARFTHYDALLDNERGLGSGEFVSVNFDRAGSVWAATKGNGVIIIDKDEDSFASINFLKDTGRKVPESVKSLHVINDESLLIGVKSLGYGIYNIEEGSFQHYKTLMPYNSNLVSINTVESVAKDGKNNLWLGTRYLGLIKHNLETNEISLFNREYRDDFRVRKVNSMAIDSLNRIWAASSSGLYLLTPAGNDYSIRKIQSVNSYLNNKTEIDINSIVIDSNNALWIATSRNGLIKSKGDIYSERLAFERVSLHKGESTVGVKNILSIYKDSNNNLWVGTNGYGFYLFNKGAVKAHVFNNSVGFYSDIVYNFQEDKQGYLWILTNKGVTRFKYDDTSENVFVTYSMYDGLNGNIFSESCIDSIGNIYLGGSYGLNKVNPLELNVNQVEPLVHVTDVKVVDEKIRVNEQNNSVLINESQNIITINFTAISLRESFKNRFAYKLEGFDNEWVYTNPNQKSVTYTNLKPGDYIFKVKASNNHDIWSDNNARLNITVEPAAYKTWWAFLIYLVLILVITLYLRNNILNRIKLKQEVELEHIKLQEVKSVNDFKLKFFTNVSHELLTPLTVINCIVERAEHKQITGNDITILDRSANKLVYLIKQLLEFRKVETNSINLSVQKGDLSSFLKLLAYDFEPIAEKTNISFKQEIDEGFKGWFDADIVEKVVQNILSNAFKHTEKGSEVSVAVTETIYKGFQAIEVLISDTGNGIPQEELPYIFDRFYKAENYGNTSFNTGIGLALVKELIDYHLGNVEVDSVIGEGTKFKITMPIDEKAFPKQAVNQEPFNPEEFRVTKLDSASLMSHEVKNLNEDSILEMNTENKVKILLAEDNVDFRTVLKDALNNDFYIKVASDGKEAFELIAKEEFDLVISDVMMPNIGGYELCEKLKDSIKTSHIPVILLTAKQSSESKIEGYTHGADSYLTKPVNLQLLKSRIASLLDTRQKLQNHYQDYVEITPDKTVLSVDEIFLKKAKQFVLDNILESELSIKDLCSHLGVSNSTLYRKMISLTGMKPNEFIRKIRLKTAAKLLLKQSMSISSVMYETGYKDLSYFGRCFKKEFGVSPTEYIKSNLG